MLAGVAQREAAGESGGREQQARDELARGGRIDRELAPLDGARAVHRERHRAAAVVADVDAEAAQGLDRRPHRSPAGLRVAVDADRPEGERRDRREEAHDRAGQAAVDRDPAEQLAGSDRQVGAEVAVARHLGDRDAELLQPLDHERGVAGVERMDEAAGSVGECGEHEFAVRQALRAGEPEAGIERSGCDRRRPQDWRTRVVRLGGVAPGVEQVGVATGIPKDTHRLTRVYRQANREDGRRRC